MSKVVVMDHPLIEQKIGIIRRKETGTKDFRQNISEIAMLIGYEATKDLPLEEVEIETPICKTTVKQLKGKKLALVPILRAGLGMVDGMLSLIPAAKVGHIGLYRNPETLKPVEYYCKLPADCAEREVFVVDPMLATGGSSIAAIQLLKDKGCKSIRLLCIIAAPEGVKAMQEAHPDVDIYIGALDQKLNDHGYIVPGLGDAGDRIFGTKYRRHPGVPNAAIISAGMKILWGWPTCLECGPRTRIPRWEPALSARTTRSCPWDTTASPRVVPTMSSPGRGRTTMTGI